MKADDLAVVLFAHGSRDPLWSRPIEAIAARMAALEPGVPVRCAYLELMQPDLASAVRALAETGAQHIRILPRTWNDDEGPRHWGFEAFLHYGVGADNSTNAFCIH